MECAVLIKAVGERVRELRKAKGLSQETLAELSGLHPVFVSRVETGKVKGSLCTYQALADALGTTLAALVEADAWDGELALLFDSAKRLRPDQQSVFIETVRGVLKGLEGR